MCVLSPKMSRNTRATQSDISTIDHVASCCVRMILRNAWTCGFARSCCVVLRGLLRAAVTLRAKPPRSGGAWPRNGRNRPQRNLTKSGRPVTPFEGGGR